MTRCIEYKGGYKYQLQKCCSIQIGVIPPAPIKTEYVELDAAGCITIREGYAWDGPSGPTIDTLTFMRGSLVHDALYQLMRERELDHLIYREAADRVLQSICLEDGMWSLRAWLVYHAVRLFADPAADPADKRLSTFAPRGCEPPR
jgi:hypothetical protein